MRLYILSIVIKVTTYRNVQLSEVVLKISNVAYIYLHFCVSNTIYLYTPVNCLAYILYLNRKSKLDIFSQRTFHNDITNDHGYVPLVASTSQSFPRSWLIPGFVTRLTRRVSLVEQKLPTLPEYLSSPPVFCGVRVTRSLVLYVCFVDQCLSFCTFSFGHCVDCSSSIYGFWLPLWYLHTLLVFISTYMYPSNITFQWLFLCEY